MEFRLKLRSDSHNSNPYEFLEILDTESEIILRIGDREVSVTKEEVVKVLKVIT